MRQIVVAIGQMQIEADIGRNGAEIRRVMRQAQGTGARLILFPEGSPSGYVK